MVVQIGILFLVCILPVQLEGQIDDPTEETILSVSEGDLAGTQIVIAADPGRGEFEFEIGTVLEPPDITAPETVQLEVKGLSLDTSKPFDVIIKPGWNMVANPFKGSVTLEVSKDGITFKSPSEATDLIGSDFHRFDPHPDSDTGATVWYTPMSLETEPMTPYEGYWLENLHRTNITNRFKPSSLSSSSAALEKNSLSPFYGKLIRFARSSLHKVMDVISIISYADKRSNSQPPPPPATGGADSNVTGNISGDGGGGCFVDTVTNNGLLVTDGRAMVLFVALVSGLAAVFLVERRLRME